KAVPSRAAHAAANRVTKSCISASVIDRLRAKCAGDDTSIVGAGLAIYGPDVLPNGNQAAVTLRLNAGFSTTPSCSRSQRFRSNPPPYLISEPLAPIRRWQGTTTLIGLEPLACPTARTALGMPSWDASAP